MKCSGCRKEHNGITKTCESCKKRNRKFKKTPEFREWRIKYNNSPNGRLSNRKCFIKSRYGITLDDYNRMFEEQGGKCAICDESSDKALLIDHNHKNNNVRQLLCNYCNVMLGQARDSVARLRKAADYLEHHNQLDNSCEIC